MNKRNGRFVKTKSNRFFALIFSFVLVLSVFSCIPSAVSAEAKQTLQYVENPACNILNAPTNIAIIDSMDTLQGLQEGKPSNAMMYVDASLNVNTKDGTNITTVETALASFGNNIIPAFYVKDNATADALTKYLKEKSITDVLIISADSAVAKYAVKKYPISRNAVDYTALSDAEITDEKLFEIRGTTTTANSLIAILPSKHATAHNVYYLQSLGVTVWVMNDNLSADTEIAKIITSGATGIISNDYKRVFSAYTSLFEANTMTKTPLIIGHRGNPSQAPENSISSYLKAVENGADVVETDVQLTKDNKILVMHDGSIARTSSYDGTATVAQMTLDEIKKYFLWGEGNKFKSTYPTEPIPTFEEMLIALKDSDCKIFLEIKTGDARIIQPLADLINQYNYQNRIFVICFTGSQLTALQKVMPTMGTGLLTSMDAYTSPAMMHEKLYAKFVSFHSFFSTFNPSYGGISDDLLSALRHRGITYWPWTYSAGNAVDFSNAFLWGVDGITTNDAQYSKNMVKNLSTSENKISLASGGTASVTAEKGTYGRVKTSILGDANIFVKFIEGNDVVSFDNGTITALKDGTASFMLGYKTKTVNGKEYVLYTQPFEITVGQTAGENSANTAGDFPTTTVIVAGLLLLIALGSFLIVKTAKPQHKAEQKAEQQPEQKSEEQQNQDSDQQ